MFARTNLTLFIFLSLSLIVANATAQDRVDEIEALLNKYQEYGMFNGTVLVADEGKVLYKNAFGEANKAWGIPNRTDTKFRIGSITKQFTAAIILQLVEEGLIDLDDPITKYLNNYPADQGERVTIHHLLTHTSGIPNYTSLSDFLEFTRDPYEPNSFITVFSELDLEFEPGSQFNYSNSGYFLLGVIIEHVTGKPYDEVLNDRLLEPLDLSDTGYQHHGDIIEHMASGYNKFGGRYSNAPYLDTSIPYSAGMMYSTVEDLYKWNHFLQEGAVFKKTETLERMLTPFLDNYAYGIAVFNMPVGEDSVRTITHNGGIFGFSSDMKYFPDTGRTVVVLDNAGGAPGAITNSLTLLLFGQDVPEPKRPISDVIGMKLEEEGIAAAKEHYRQLREGSPEEYNFGQWQLIGLGYGYLFVREIEKAIAVFELNTEAYPEFPTNYEALGEAYLAAGDTEKAISIYEKALALNPENKTAIAALKKLQGD